MPVKVLVRGLKGVASAGGGLLDGAVCGVIVVGSLGAAMAVRQAYAHDGAGARRMTEVVMVRGALEMASRGVRDGGDGVGVERCCARWWLRWRRCIVTRIAHGLDRSAAC